MRVKGFVTGSNRNPIGGVHGYWQKGVEFSYDADAKVRSIFVFKPVGAAPAGFDGTLQQEQVLDRQAALEKYYDTQ